SPRTATPTPPPSRVRPPPPPRAAASAGTCPREPQRPCAPSPPPTSPRPRTTAPSPCWARPTPWSVPAVANGGPSTWSRPPTADRATMAADAARAVLGRAGALIDTGGRKVLPQDVERALDRSLMLRGRVRAGVVVGVEDRDWGERVEALVTLEPGVEPEEAPALVRAALRTAEVPSHQIPKRVHVVEQLPLLGHGKIDRAAARALAAGRAGP